jgi:hypothetical protein
MIDLGTALNRAEREAELAYQFSPGSYTYAALSRIHEAQSCIQAVMHWTEMMAKLPNETEY